MIARPGAQSILPSTNTWCSRMKSSGSERKRKSMVKKARGLASDEDPHYMLKMVISRARYSDIHGTLRIQPKPNSLP